MASEEKDLLVKSTTPHRDGWQTFQIVKESDDGYYAAFQELSGTRGRDWPVVVRKTKANRAHQGPP
ncbi:hypothetical protein [Micromonospora echinospora]|uniref:hypothetical protein n=1 Tax=Micromonospora echinospora TaxID=1877 RepID=UPI003A8AE95E